MQPTRGRPRWLQIAALMPMQLAWVFLIAAGLRVIALGSGPLGVVLIGAGAITGYLALRRLAGAIKAPGEVDPGELQGAAFDYIVWTAVGLPVVVVVALLIAVLFGSGR
jgi:hypothetical protein